MKPYPDFHLIVVNTQKQSVILINIESSTLASIHCQRQNEWAYNADLPA
jgi:hypothetical protein